MYVTQYGDKQYTRTVQNQSLEGKTEPIDFVFPWISEMRLNQHNKGIMFIAL